MPPKTVALAVFISIAIANPAATQVLYVDTDSPGPIHDGATWCTAFTELHEALAAAPSGTTIRIAAGVYLPDPTGLGDPRQATFALPPGVDLRGGHAGCGAPDPDLRDPAAFPTVLSGDLAGDDPSGHLDDNAYTVVTADFLPEPVILDGLVIRAGNGANDDLGGGILSLASTLRLITCTLEDNRSWRGGALYAEGGDLEFHLCRFVANATTGEGGAIFHATANIVVDNCLFALNAAASDGGAIFSDLAYAHFTNCSFGGNTSASCGGAIYDYVGVATVVGNTILWGNSDNLGSGEHSQLFINPSNSLQIDYSCVQGWTGAFGGEGNLGDDPEFLDLTAGDLHLTSGSPCIDAGDNGLVFIQVDLDGNPRIVNGDVDLGCYEYPMPTGVADPTQRARILSVTSNASQPGNVIRYLPPAASGWSLEVFDLRGRRVIRVAGSTAGSDVSSPRETFWDGRDRAGRRVAPGVYLVALSGHGEILDAHKVVRLR